MLEDIAILTGGKMLSEDLGIKLENVEVSDLGCAKKVTINKDNTTIVEGAGKTSDIQARVALLKKQIDSLAVAGFSAAQYVGGETPVAFIVEDGDESPVNELPSLLNVVRERGRKGLSIQRYKGLGEMNPDQLYDTTMDPAQRRLLRVRLEDAVRTDGIFTLLMGDEVEPRRKFIEDNALNVRNLDI
jgi:DNA gyrase subunit B